MGLISGGYCLLISSLALNSEFCKHSPSKTNILTPGGSLELYSADGFTLDELLLTTSSPTRATRIITPPMRNSINDGFNEEGITEVSDWRDKYMVQNRLHRRISGDVISKKSMIYNSYDDEENPKNEPKIFPRDDTTWEFVKNTEMSENTLTDAQTSDGELFYI